MANQKISTLPAAAALTGSELMELVQAGANVKDTLDGTAQYSILRHVAVNPGAGTFTDNVVPGFYDYILDYDVTAGDINLNGFIAQRHGQKIIVRATGSGTNKVNVGGQGMGSAGNQISASSAVVTSLLVGDSKAFQFSTDLLMWVQL